MNPQLIEYIKAALASGQTRDAVKVALIQNGWKTEDIQAGFDATSPADPSIPVMAMSVSAHSKLPIALGAVAIVVVFLGAGGWVWATQQPKNSDATVANVSLPSATTSESVSVGTTGTSTAIVGPEVTSEIDKYGVDLYTLKQGTTTIDKATPVKTKIVYTRTGDTIERNVTQNTSGSTSTMTNTIDMNAKKNLPAMIHDIEIKVAADCSDSTSKTCSIGKKFIAYLKTTCLPLTTNEEVSGCILAATMGAATGSL